MNVYAALTLASVVLKAFTKHWHFTSNQTGYAILFSIGLMLICVGGRVFVSIVMIDRLPVLISGSPYTPYNQVLNWLSRSLLIASIAIVLVFIPGRNPAYLWLRLALTAMLFSNVMGSASGGRYTVGWSVARISWLLSASILFLFFMRQFARQQPLLLQVRDMLEQNVEQRTADLQRTARQRDLLLREVYHRVKNNLQVVDSLIAMKRHNLKDVTAKDRLAGLRNRVFTLGLVHQQLMLSDNLENFSTAPFLQELTENIMASFSEKAAGIEVIVACDPVPVTLDFAIPLGVLTIEFLTNVIKYAGATVVRVEFSHRDNGSATLAVGDNGPSMPSEDSTPYSHTGVGSRIIAGITKQLDGQMQVVRQGGMRVEISMPLL